MREVVVDADGHVLEPPDLWEKHLPSAMRSRGIRLRWNADTGYDERFIEDKIYAAGGAAGLGNAGQSFVNHGKGMHYEDLNPAGFDPAERIKALDAEGIDVAVLYPGLGLALGGIEDPALAAASCRVYNDWIADFVAQGSGRLYGVGALPIQDPPAATAEVAHIVELGLNGAFVRPNPTPTSPLYGPDLDPVWSALEEAGLALAFHPAGHTDVAGAARGLQACMAPGTHHPNILMVDDYLTLSNLVYGGVLDRHPKLQVAILESGGGWIGHWMDRMDEFYESYAWLTPGLGERPSDLFRRQCVISFDPGEHTMPMLADFVGPDTFMWASDFPHSDAKYPGVVDELRERTEQMEPHNRAKLFGENALRLYRIAPTAIAA